MAVMYASKMYFLPLLTKECRKYLMMHVDQDNVCTILEQSVLFNDSELIERCLKFIAPVTQSVFSCEDFLGLGQPALRTLMEYNFYCENEIRVYESCLQWAKEQCKKKALDSNDENLRQVLGDVIYQIRFTSMQDSDFAKIANKSEILTDQEKVDIFVFRTGDEATKEDLLKKLMFNHQPRPQAITIDRFESVKREDRRWCYNESRKDGIAFRSHKEIVLLGVSVYGGNEMDEHIVKVEIRDSDSELLSELSEARMISDGSSTPQPIFLTDPVSIHPSETYHVCLTIKGPVTYFGTGGHQCVTCNDVCLEFYNYEECMNGTKVGIGQIPALIILPMK